jgi:hypothetical protein
VTDTAEDRPDARQLAALAVGVVSPMTAVEDRVAELRRVGDRETATDARQIVALLQTTDPDAAGQALAVLEVAFPTRVAPPADPTTRPGGSRRPRRRWRPDGPGPGRARSGADPDEVHRHHGRAGR